MSGETPHDQMLQALEDALSFLAFVPDAEELCDRIVGLIEPGKCQAPSGNCGGTATTLVWSSYRRRVFNCCKDHAFAIRCEDHPEYVEECPNCGCTIPIV